ncbi:receptor-like protein 13 [Benincasa hispida]|uniref:receptor-like protein 13 n=1 Tax=Benincasa hispida TaxID=102211 RepID=UPI0019021EFB|nr:receptor-like protein 13 [Benincasa hispida]
MELKFRVIKWLSLTLLLIIMIVVGDLQVSNGCVEEERMGLLHIKSMFLSYSSSQISEDNPFSSWIGTNCCNWDRVQCDTFGTHVVDLFLSKLLDRYYSMNQIYYLLNVSLFQNFKKLKTLDLTYNGFIDFTKKQGFNKFSSFNKLETLNLSRNHFGNKVLSSLSGLTSLKKLMLNRNSLEGSITLLGLENLRELDLSENALNGTLQMQGVDGFSSLKNLEILNLGQNNLNDSIFSSLRGLKSLRILNLLHNDDLGGIIPTKDIAKLRSLEILDLSGHNYYGGVIPLKDLKNLRVLDLSYNKFNSSLPIQGFCETNSLVELNLRNNQIRGKFSECVGNFTRLKVVDISYNQFSGKIPTTISKLTSMEYLSFHENHFEGTFSFSSLANHSKLWYLKLSGRSNIGNIQVETEEVPEWKPTFQLEILSLPSCNLNDQTTSKIPSFLLSQHKLKYLDLAHNRLLGHFPFWLLQNNYVLEHLDLSNNSLSGPLQISTWNHSLRFLEISSNHFSGQLPTHLGLLLPQVENFNISRNNFEGNLPPSMKQMNMLSSLDVSNNKFSGEVKIFMSNNMPSLAILVLANNNFSGSIEDEWKKKTQLIVLDISKNTISGKIPSWIGSLTLLQYLLMSRNRFAGELPIQICSLFKLKMLDVSQNQLVGEVPSTCFNSSSLVYLYMQNNGFFEAIPQVLLSETSSSLKIIDLSYNNFSGHILKWLNKFRSLRVLLLKGNQLEGPIPTQLCQMRQISIMDLSNNKLNGLIPSCFNNITFGDIKALNFSAFEAIIYFIEDGTIENCRPPRYDGQCLTRPPIIQVQVQFTTKHRSESYKANGLNYMFGLDLSSNQLTGVIPRQIGDFVQIHAINFSYNKLVGPIPKVFSNLKQLESLDLSNNLLSGNIPFELAMLDFLSIFNVSYNNLSGMIPTSPHFTYPESSFYGNPYLCGPYIEHKCSISHFPPIDNQFEPLEEENGVFIDLEAFCWSFAASYIIILLGFVAILYINPQWRQRWFYFIESCYYYFCKCT